MLHLLVWLEPGYICSKARIFALELLPKEDCKLDTLKLSYLAIWTCVFHIDPGYRGQETSRHEAGQLGCRQTSFSPDVCCGWGDGQSVVPTVTSFVVYSRCCF